MWVSYVCKQWLLLHYCFDSFEIFFGKEERWANVVNLPLSFPSLSFSSFFSFFPCLNFWAHQQGQRRLFAYKEMFHKRIYTLHPKGCYFAWPTCLLKMEPSWPLNKCMWVPGGVLENLLWLWRYTARHNALRTWMGAQLLLYEKWDPQICHTSRCSEPQKPPWGVWEIKI